MTSFLKTMNSTGQGCGCLPALLGCLFENKEPGREARAKGTQTSSCRTGSLRSGPAQTEHGSFKD